MALWAQGDAAPVLSVSGGSLLGGSLQRVSAGPDNWHQYRGRLRFTALGQVSLDVAAGAPPLRLDEVRLCPVGAQLITYTHDPLVGVTSQTDPAGRTMFYEYDGLNRLVRTRDEQGHILAQQHYHYAGQ